MKQQSLFFTRTEIRKIVLCSLLFIPVLLMGVPVFSLAEPLSQDTVKLYIDADFSNAASSSIAIEQGIRTALDEVHNKVAGHRVTVTRKNHRGNSRRSLENLTTYLADPQALALFSGLHSPPLLANRRFINENSILLLDPWAAAAPITRYPSSQNWIFRLSVDDSKAGFTIVDHAVGQRKIRKPALLLEDTGWGKSNEKTMSEALTNHGLTPTGVFWFNWGLQERTARIILRSIIDSGADSILLVANTPEAKVICRALLAVKGSVILPVFSHWGLTGGDFPEVISYEQRQQIDLSFLQTDFSFISNSDDQNGQRVLARAEKLFPEEIRSAEDIKAPAGFIHAYDLTRLLIAAMEQAGLTGNIQKDRQRTRESLENIKTPVQGLIKTYSRPFGQYSQAVPDAHEALGMEDFTMGYYNRKNGIELFERGTR
jgi:branched-chain amino acid transport system substrate-binding protein